VGGGLTAFRARETSPTRAARTGASVVTGYAVALLAGSFPLGASLGPYSAAPALPVLPAVGYPLVFGAMGGVATAVVSTTPVADRTIGSSDRRSRPGRAGRSKSGIDGPTGHRTPEPDARADTRFVPSEHRLSSERRQ